MRQRRRRPSGGLGQEARPTLTHRAPHGLIGARLFRSASPRLRDSGVPWPPQSRRCDAHFLSRIGGQEVFCYLKNLLIS